MSIIMTENSLTIKERVRQYILEASHAEAEKIKIDSFLFKEGFFDSMGFILLITFIEEEFGIKTIDADLVEDNFESIIAISDFIIRKTEG